MQCSKCCRQPSKRANGFLVGEAARHREMRNNPTMPRCLCRLCRERWTLLESETPLTVPEFKKPEICGSRAHCLNLPHAMAPLSKGKTLKYGYAGVSTDEQNPTPCNSLR